MKGKNTFTKEKGEKTIPLNEQYCKVKKYEQKAVAFVGKTLFALLFCITLTACSGDDIEKEVLDAATVTLDDMFGTWVVTSSDHSKYNGIKLILKRSENILWLNNKFGLM